MAGGLAGVACWLPAIPQDVIKSRYILNNRNEKLLLYIILIYFY